MPRNVRTYDHFCVLARTLEQVGDRWSLLVVRDLVSGRKRFTDLMERLGGITPKTLTQRLRELEAVGVVEVHREPGRRESWYELTQAGLDLEPAIEALSWWGLRHAWRPPRPGERLHVEHLLRALVQVVDRTADDHRPARWAFHFSDDGDYLVRSDGDRWSLATVQADEREDEQADVTVTTTTDAWMRFVTEPTRARAREVGVELAGTATALRRFERHLHSFADTIDRPGTT